MGWVSGWKILIIWTYILGPIFGSHYYKTLPVLLTLPPPPAVYQPGNFSWSVKFQSQIKSLKQLVTKKSLAYTFSPSHTQH